MSRSRFANGEQVTPATAYWGRRLPDQPTDFILGYGSLINGHLRDQTSLKPIAGAPVRLSAAFGYLSSTLANLPGCRKG